MVDLGAGTGAVTRLLAEQVKSPEAEVIAVEPSVGAIEVARRLAPRRTLLTHMSHELEHEATNAALPQGMELAYDGLRVPLG